MEPLEYMAFLTAELIRHRLALIEHRDALKVYGDAVEALAESNHKIMQFLRDEIKRYDATEAVN